MLKYLVDENLPYHFSIWKGESFVHVADLKLGLKDNDLWDFAKKNNLVIITKDADFSNKIMLSNPPPSVIHVRLGNLKIKELFLFMSKNWQDITTISNSYKLVNIFEDRIEGIE